MTPTEIKSAKTAALLAFYNTATGKSIKRFATRAAAEKQCLALIPKGARAVTGSTSSNGGSKLGRPKATFKVKANSEGKSKVGAKSLRRQLLDWLKDQPAKTASIEAIEAQFGRNMRGVVDKLEEVKWLDRA